MALCTWMSTPEAAGTPGAPGGPQGEGGPSAAAPNLTSNRRLQQTQAQVDEVVDIMRVNVDKVLERDQKLSELDDRADALQAGASQFESSAAKLKNKYWWKNCKVLDNMAPLHHPSSIIHPPSSIIHHPSSIIHPCISSTELLLKTNTSQDESSPTNTDSTKSSLFVLLLLFLTFPTNLRASSEMCSSASRFLCFLQKRL
ncbi:unnamed protein product [Pleuronectes platessa]|uniref:V-SNARE coiled-coil homology domain-containing protein n=1 Tax=Pleuronectes platessa TaxID=8262 RepID=A0A9N7VPB1_PLEPL|nr:unnamed protein product [Pleuronectes platessa]